MASLAVRRSCKQNGRDETSQCAQEQCIKSSCSNNDCCSKFHFTPQNNMPSRIFTNAFACKATGCINTVPWLSATWCWYIGPIYNITHTIYTMYIVVSMYQHFIRVNNQINTMKYLITNKVSVVHYLNLYVTMEWEFHNYEIIIMTINEKILTCIG